MTAEYKTADEMKLLDQFAVAALTGMIAKGFAYQADQMAGMAYAYAIQMAKIREMVLATPPEKLNHTLSLKVRGAE